MMDLKQQLTEAVDREEDESIAKRIAHWHTLPVATRGDIAQFENYRTDRGYRQPWIDKACEFINLVNKGVIQKGEMKTSLSTGGFAEEASLNGIGVDLGLSLVYEATNIRLTSTSFYMMYGKLGIFPYMGITYDVIQPFIQKRLDSLQLEHGLLCVELFPEANRMTERHAKKLAKSRERAARPDNVAKRAQEARDRARVSLSKLMELSTFKPVIDKWSPQELLNFLKLCHDSGDILLELEGWARKLPLGAKQLQLDDIQAALDLAKVRGVMES
jgi:hypothetical protein